MAKRGNPAKRPAAHKGMGWAAAVESAREGGARNPEAAIAAGAQHASAAAKAKNPNLTKVGGVGRNKKAGKIG